MIKVTDSAKIKIKELLAKENKPVESLLRVTVEGGGCSGLLYKLDFVENLQEDDLLIEHNEVRLAVPKKNLLYLAGTELDYSDGLNGRGFRFHNPNATRTCGCGESFSV
jgi:iron-sulfur cluster assembly protein